MRDLKRRYMRHSYSNHQLIDQFENNDFFELCKGFINKFLSLKIWVPLSRLSYAVYLIHFCVIEFFIYRSEHPVYLQHDLIVIKFYYSYLLVKIDILNVSQKKQADEIRVGN
jgi:hypothetical protein